MAYLKDKGDFQFELAVGSSGVFGVWLGDRLIYSKFNTKVFPDHEKLWRQIESEPH